MGEKNAKENEINSVLKATLESIFMEHGIIVHRVDAEYVDTGTMGNPSQTLKYITVTSSERMF